MEMDGGSRAATGVGQEGSNGTRVEAAKGAGGQVVVEAKRPGGLGGETGAWGVVDEEVVVETERLGELTGTAGEALGMGVSGESR